MTTVIQERDLCRVRLRLLDLCKSFFEQPPDAEKLARWRGIFAALARAQVSPAFDREAGVIAGLLWKMGLQELQGEYRRVLVEPFPGSPATASFFRQGRRRGEAAEGIREIMAEAGLTRDPAAEAPEDSLVVMLDILAALVEEEKTDDDWRARELQDRLLVEYLVPRAKQLTAILNGNGHADFYLHCSRLLGSYLDLELELADERYAVVQQLSQTDNCRNGIRGRNEIGMIVSAIS